MTTRSKSTASTADVRNKNTNRIVVSGGTVVSQGKELVTDVAIDGGVIVEIGNGL